MGLPFGPGGKLLVAIYDSIRAHSRAQRIIILIHLKLEHPARVFSEEAGVNDHMCFLAGHSVSFLTKITFSERAA